MHGYLGELIGTFVFVVVILFTIKNFADSSFVIPFVVAMGLLVGIVVSSGSGGAGHINPAVSTAFWLKVDINGSKWAGFVIAQVFGAILAYGVYKLITGRHMCNKNTMVAE